MTWTIKTVGRLRGEGGTSQELLLCSETRLDGDFHVMFSGQPDGHSLSEDCVCGPRQGQHKGSTLFYHAGVPYMSDAGE